MESARGFAGATLSSTLSFRHSARKSRPSLGQAEENAHGHHK
jgi:hypothetical protein